MRNGRRSSLCSNEVGSYLIWPISGNNGVKKEDIIFWGKTKEDVEKQLIQKRFDL